MMMKLLSFAAVAVLLSNAAAATVQGFDISYYQPKVDFEEAYKSGARFVIIKATEGTDYIDPTFLGHYVGAAFAQLIKGGYHFAHPDRSSGSAQATFFLNHGGGWLNDGFTLPGMLDIEYNPSGNECYGLSGAEMVNWISDFVETYHAATSRYPMIYSTADWWISCTGNSYNFNDICPLVLADRSGSLGSIPGGWPSQTIWQNSDHYEYGGDSDVFNGDLTQLQKIALG